MTIRSYGHYFSSTMIVLLSSVIANAATSTWTGTGGGTASWGTTGTTVPNPGWDTGSAPSNPGDIARFIDTITGANAVTTQDTGVAVTVGAIQYGNNNDMGDFSWQITNTNGITLNSNGAGFATISNSSTNAGANNALIFIGGTITLADNLNVINTTTGSTSNNGAIQLGLIGAGNTTVLAGTGNLTLNSAQTIDAAATPTQAHGAIRLFNANTFVGNTTIERGLVAFTNIASFGPVTTNTINLGVPGADSATLIWQNAASTGVATAAGIPNPIVVSAGNTGILSLGSVSTAANAQTNYSGAITLNGDLHLTSKGSATAIAVNIFSIISGPGDIIKVGSGFVQILPGFHTSTTTAVNLYTGDTIVNEGTLVVGNTTRSGNSIPDGPGKGNVVINSSGTIWTGGSETINGLSGSGIVTTSTSGGNRTLTVGANDATSTFFGTMQDNTSRLFNLSKTGTGTLTLSGTSTYSGATTVNGGTLQFARRVAFYNGNAAASPNLDAGEGWTTTLFRVNSGATAAFNVGGVDEFTDADIATIQALGAAATNSGFGDGSSIGLDTTNAAGGEFVYGNVIANTFAGANNIGLTKLGANTLKLTGVSTYTGPTTVAGGLLNVDTTGSIDGSKTINVNAVGALLANHIRAELALNLTGSATVRADGGTLGASKVETLNVSTGGQLNLKNNDLVVGTGTLSAVRDQIKLGLSGVSNAAAAAGITSDMMTVGVHGFGYALGNDVNRSPLIGGPGAGGTLSGQTYDADSVLVKFTYRGDADLDGDSDLDDLGFWANSFTGDLGLGPVAAPTTLWTQGDWDYDGDTDLDDLGFWSSTFTGDLGGGGLSAYAPNASEGAIAVLASMGITAVPEPTSIVLIGIGFAGVVLRSVRRRVS